MFRRALPPVLSLLTALVFVACSDAAGDDSPSDGSFGGACNVEGDCDSDLSCITVDPLVGAVCTSFCDTSVACPAGSRCVQTDTGGICSPGAAPKVDNPGNNGVICNPDEENCEAEPECTQDGDCGADQTCVAGSCQDDTPPEGCQNDTDCGVAETCNRLTGNCEPANPGTCRDDRFEPNDEASTPSLLTPNTYEDLTICSGETHDFYRVDVTAGQTIRTRIDFLHDDGNLDIELLSTAGDVLLRSTSMTDNEMVARQVGETGSYLIHVFGATGTVETTYDLTLTVEGGPTETCDGDAYEPNDSAGSARMLTGGTFPAAACADDDDWFRLQPQAGAEVTVTVGFSHADGDINVALYAEDGTTLLDQSTGTTDREEVTTTADGGALLVRVDTQRAMGESTYNITVNLGNNVDPGCNDMFEPNNSNSTATPLAPGSYANLSVCAFDDEDDYYAIQLEGGMRIVAEALFSHDEVDIDMQLLNTDGATFLRSAASGTDNEMLQYTVASTGTYYLRVYPYFDEAGTYSLNITVEDGPDCDDTYEPNNTWNDAANLTAGQYPGIGICPSPDDDYYSIAVEPGERVTASIDFDNGVADLDLVLLGTNGVTELDLSDSSGPSETVSATSTTSGFFYVRVLHYSGGPASYDLDISVVSACEDQFEPNNSIASATDAGVGSQIDLSTCEDIDENDYFRIDLLGGEEIYVEIFWSGGADLDLGLLNENLDYVEVSNSEFGSDEFILYFVPLSGTYYIHVNHFEGPAALYDIFVSVL